MIRGMTDELGVGPMTRVRCALLIGSQRPVFVHVGYARRPLMCQQVATQCGFRFVGIDHGFQKKPLEALTWFAFHSIPY
jgi:hypothetical protein